MDLFQQFCAEIAHWIHLPQLFIRFALVGCVNTIFAYCIYALAIFMGLHYTLAVLMSTIIGTCFSFKTLGALVFENPDNRLIFKFVAVYILCYFLNIGLLRILIQFVLSNLYVAGLLSSCLVSLVSFCLNKWVVFRKPSKTRENFIS
ncbi:MAG: GtrA family protein [Elusimicrobiaceae bacterium]|nr:GtrA family protein [Elusimicrobiaceae bacterium]